MDNRDGFALKRVYPSEQGLHFELYSKGEARAACEYLRATGKTVECDGLVVTWCFHNPRIEISEDEATGP